MERIKYDLGQEEDKLDIFLLRMEDEETVFIAEAQRQGYKLDRGHSMDSLTDLERYVREARVNFQDSSDKALDERTNCWYYIGEVVRKNFTGRWAFSMNEENPDHWGDYVIVGHSPVTGLEFEPLGLLQGFILRGCKPGALRRAILFDVDPVGSSTDLSDLPDEKPAAGQE